MKNIKLFSLLFVAAAMIFAGCTKETESVEPGTEEGLVYKEFTVGVSEASGSKSRTELGDGGSVLWQVGDEIRVFADVDGANADGYKFTVTEIQDGGKSATIGGEVANAAKYYGLYPYDAYSEEGGLKKENGSVYISANIPDVQKLPVNGGYDPKACISVANLGDGTSPSQFKLACGMIGLTFTSTDNISIKELDVSFKDYSIIERSFMKIDVVDGVGETRFNLLSKPQNFKIIPDNGGGNFNNGITYYVCLPAFNASQRIDIDFIEAESGATLTKSVTGQIQRAYLEKSPTLTLSNSDYNKEIATAGQFEDWYLYEIDKYPKVILTDDIDMTGKPLTSKSFSGIFDGGGYTISNLTMNPLDEYENNGLFSELTGASKVKNLILKNLVINETTSHVGGICGMDDANNETEITGCSIINAEINGSYCGGIIGMCNNATIDGCVVENVTMSGGLLGGLVYYLSGENCMIKASYVTGKIDGSRSGGFAYDWSASTAKLISCYSFTELNGTKVGYISVNGEPNEMLSSYYISNSIDEEDGIKVIAIETLQKKVEDLNNFLNSANSLYNYTKDNTGTDYSNPPLKLVKK
ncbi:fimbrillin family protein [Bacteroides caecigallinarum]|nr:fimbrillin family protein [Bacteroides caecigallinarum]